MESIKYRITLNLVLIAFTLAYIFPVSAIVIHVSAEQPTIQDGVNAAVDGDTVLIADGIYETPTGFEGIQIANKSITVIAEHSGLATIDCENTGRGFVINGITSENVVLSGLKVINGNHSAGGAIVCTDIIIQIENCTFTDNTVNNSGGSLSLSNCIAVDITGCTFTGNHADTYGGAIFCEYTSSSIIDDCLFESNTCGSDGGSIFGYTVNNSQIENSIFRNNNSDGSGGSIYIFPGAFNFNLLECEFTGNSASSGGACCISSASFDPGIISGCSFVSNIGDTAVGYGGGLSTENIPITDCFFSGNSAGCGGGLSCNHPGYLTDCHFTSNTATDIGGGLLFAGACDSIANCLFEDNVAIHGGGFGQSNLLPTSAVTLTNCTFNNNQASHGGALSFDFMDYISVSDCILWNNIATFGPEISCYLPPYIFTLSYNNITGGQTGIYLESGGSVTWGPGNIDSDPLFAPGPLGGFYLSQTAAGQPVDSPSVNSGSNLSSAICFATTASTVCMNERITRSDQQTDTGIVDMGYHYPIGPVPLPVTTPIGICLILVIFTGWIFYKK
ncbi:hypothetical protein K8T06_09835 [bacterium]|nr:hypothetical protein [bacterium]